MIRMVVGHPIHIFMVLPLCLYTLETSLPPLTSPLFHSVDQNITLPLDITSTNLSEYIIRPSRADIIKVTNFLNFHTTSQS